MTKPEAQAILEGVAEDEPVWVLRGADRLAPGALRGWVVATRSSRGTRPETQAALDTAKQMDAWRAAHVVGKQEG